MDQTTMAIYHEVQENVSFHMNNIIRYMGVIVPTCEEDKRILAIGNDMLKTTVKDLARNPDEVFDMDAVIRDWGTKLNPLITSVHDRITLDTISDIVSCFEGDIDETFED